MVHRTSVADPRSTRVHVRCSKLSTSSTFSRDPSGPMVESRRNDGSTPHSGPCRHHRSPRGMRLFQPGRGERCGARSRLGPSHPRCARGRGRWILDADRRRGPLRALRAPRRASQHSRERCGASRRDSVLRFGPVVRRGRALGRAVRRARVARTRARADVRRGRARWLAHRGRRPRRRLAMAPRVVARGQLVGGRCALRVGRRLRRIGRCCGRARTRRGPRR